MFCNNYNNLEEYCDNYVVYQNICDNNVLKDFYKTKYNISWCLKLCNINGTKSIGKYMGKYLIDDFYYFIFDFNTGLEYKDLAVFSPDSFFHHNFTDKNNRQNYIEKFNNNYCFYSLQDNEIDRYNFTDLSWHKYLKNIIKLRNCIKNIVDKKKDIETIYLLGISIGATNVYFFLIELLDMLCNNNNFLKNLKKINVKLICNTGICYNAYCELKNKIENILLKRKNINIVLNSITGLNDKTILQGIVFLPEKNFTNLEQNLVVVEPNNVFTNNFHTLPLYSNILFSYRLYKNSNIIKYFEYLSNNKINETNYLDRKCCRKNFIEQNNIFLNKSLIDFFSYCFEEKLLKNINNLYTCYIQEYCNNKILNAEINLIKNNLQKLLDKQLINKEQFDLLSQKIYKTKFNIFLENLLHISNKNLLLDFFKFIKFLLYDWIFYFKNEIYEIFYYFMLTIGLFFHFIDNCIYKYINTNLEKIKTLLTNEKLFSKTLFMLRQKL